MIVEVAGPPVRDSAQLAPMRLVLRHGAAARRGAPLQAQRAQHGRPAGASGCGMSPSEARSLLRAGWARLGRDGPLFATLGRIRPGCGV
jgi:hypothetical protein